VKAMKMKKVKILKPLPQSKSKIRERVFNNLKEEGIIARLK
jgi:hypothetical protein